MWIVIATVARVHFVWMTDASFFFANMRTKPRPTFDLRPFGSGCDLLQPKIAKFQTLPRLSLSYFPLKNIICPTWVFVSTLESILSQAGIHPGIQWTRHLTTLASSHADIEPPRTTPVAKLCQGIFGFWYLYGDLWKIISLHFGACHFVPLDI